MGPYDDLTSHRQTKILRRIVQATRETGNESWILASTFGGGTLVGMTNSYNIEKVPGERAFYEVLASLGYLHISMGSQGSLIVTPVKKAFDFTEEPAQRNSSLNPEQVAFIERFSEEVKRRNCYDWVLDGGVLYCSREGKDRGLRDVPTQFSFYKGLEQVGRVALAERPGAFGTESRRVLEITVTALGLRHAERVAMPTRGEGRRPVSVFYAYAREDESLRSELEKHLAMMKRQRLVEDWHDRKIGPGREWEGEIDAHLNTAQIILPLISPGFLASDYCYDVEMKRAMERHEAREARVIPVILRPCDWKNAPFAKLQVLPRDGKAVTAWSNKDEAFLSVVEGIRMVLEQSDPGRMSRRTG